MDGDRISLFKGDTASRLGHPADIRHVEHVLRIREDRVPATSQEPVQGLGPAPPELATVIERREFERPVDVGERLSPGVERDATTGRFLRAVGSADVLSRVKASAAV